VAQIWVGHHKPMFARCKGARQLLENEEEAESKLGLRWSLACCEGVQRGEIAERNTKAVTEDEATQRLEIHESRQVRGGSVAK
jgi:hypothetical protein